MDYNNYEMYDWGNDVKRVFAGVPMDDAFASVPHYTEKELYKLGLDGSDGAYDALAKDYMIIEQITILEKLSYLTYKSGTITYHYIKKSEKNFGC